MREIRDLNTQGRAECDHPLALGRAEAALAELQLQQKFVGPFFAQLQADGLQRLTRKVAGLAHVDLCEIAAALLAEEAAAHLNATGRHPSNKNPHHHGSRVPGITEATGVYNGRLGLALTMLKMPDTS